MATISASVTDVSPKLIKTCKRHFAFNNTDVEEEREEEEKLKVKTKKSEEKLWRKENFEDNENFEILKPVHHDPFKKVLARKEELKEKKEVLDQKEERKKLYRRYLQLLKMKKEIIESKGYFSLYFYHFFSVDIKENVDLEKIFNEIVELKLKSFFLL